MSCLRRTLLALPAILKLSLPLSAAVTPVLVKDVATNQQGTNISPYVSMGDRVLFQGVDIVHGSELWISDGLPQGTTLLKDVWPGSSSGTSSNMVRAGNLCFFSGNGGNSPGPGSELWRSNGTAEGTVMVKDIHPTSSSSPATITAWGNRVVFAADDGVHGKELWISDGTEAGTKLVADLSPGIVSTDYDSSLFSAKEVGGYLYFSAKVSGSALAKLWRTDGTPAGTSLVGDGSFFGPGGMEVMGGSLYVAASDAGSGAPSLWKVNPAGPSVLKLGSLGNPSYSYNASLEVMGGVLYFTKPLDYASTELWKTSGTVATTTLVKALGRAGGLTRMSGLSGRAGEALYFSNSTPETGVEPWVSNGTAAGTVQLLEINPGTGDSYPGFFTQIGGKAYFRADRGDDGRHLWITDGSASGTTLLKEFTGSISAMSVAGNRLVFSGTDASYGREMWASQGNAQQTYLVKNFRGTSPSDPEAFLNVGSRLFFTAKPAGWRQLMVTDGTSFGTQLTGQSSPYTVYLSGGAALGNLMIYGSQDLNDHYDLYKTDGTAEGTGKVKEIYPAGNASPQGFLSMDGYVLFSANDGVNGRELWRSDGTEAGTTLVKDVFPGSNSSEIRQMARVGDLAFFTHFGHPWRTDGTTEGTFPLGISVSSVSNLRGTGQLAFFTAQYDFQSTGLWCSDGSTAGTYRIALLPTYLFSSNPTYYTAVLGSGGLFYWLGDGPNFNGTELWRSDGTEAGTFRVLQDSGIRHEYGQGLAAFGGGVTFWLKTASGYALWRSDGTAGGTRVVIDLPTLDPAEQFYITEQIVAGGKLWFLSGNEKSGYTLWRSDGTREGTWPVPVANMPSPWKYGTILSTVGNYLIFPLDSDTYGLEFHRLPLDVNLSSPEAWTAWRQTSRLEGASADKDAIPHEDGVTNLLKYAFFLDGSRSDVTPLVPGTGIKGLPSVKISGSGENKVLRVEYLRRKGSGLNYVAKVSSTLAPGSFTPMGGTQTILPVDEFRERVIREQPVNAAPGTRIFGIVEVTGL